MATCRCARSQTKVCTNQCGTSFRGHKVYSAVYSGDWSQPHCGWGIRYRSDANNVTNHTLQDVADNFEPLQYFHHEHEDIPYCAMASQTPYEKALAAIDEAHALDPNKTTIHSKEVPYELHYAQKCTSYLEKRAPDAPEHLRLAIRAQHFRRWEVPRSSYPMTRAGYHSWRTFLKKRQAELVEAICQDAGYSEEVAQSVGALIRKEDLKQNEETQVLEDVACLVFLDDQFEAFEKEHDEDKIIKILQKTWGKMTEKGHELALQIPMGDRPKVVVAKALAG
jgi:hypothetical protein